MTTWTSDKKYTDQTAIIYDATGVTYDDARYNYDGYKPTIWAAEARN